MKKRLSAVMDAGRKRGGIIIACIIVVAVLAIGFILALNNNNTIDNTLTGVNENDIDFTNTLVLYGMPYGDHLFSIAINIFKQKYPNVEIIYTQYDDSQRYNQIIQTEIPAGKGPDLLVLSSYDFPDIYKVMETGIFYDLNNFIENDSEFDMTLYNKSVMDSGVYHDMRYIIPLCYNTNLLLTSEEAMTNAGIDFTKFNTFNGFTDEIKKYYSNGGRTNLFYSPLANYGDTLTFFPWFGVEVIDYANKTVNIDNNNFKTIMDTYKSIYQNDKSSNTRPPNNNVYTAGRDTKAVLNRQILFSMDESNYFSSLLLSYGVMLNTETPILMTFPDISNKTTASVSLMASVLSTSKNKRNAYEFLKILLSDEIQSSVDVYTIRGTPVLNDAIDKRFADTMESTGYGIVTAPVTFDDGNTLMINEISEQRLENIKSIIKNVDNCQLIVYGLYYDFVTPAMKPYFEDTDSYENCLNKLRNDLELYISE